jgi:hypothetical protein
MISFNKNWPARLQLLKRLNKYLNDSALPVLKLYDSFDPIVVRSATGPDPIAADYTALQFGHFEGLITSPD